MLEYTEGFKLTDKYLEIAVKYLSYIKLNNEKSDEFFIKIFEMLYSAKKLDEAVEVINYFVKYTKKKKKNLKAYQKALEYKIFLSTQLWNPFEDTEDLNEFEKVTIDAYGTKSHEYAKATRLLASWNMKLKNYKDAYSNFLQCYETNKEINGTEENKMSPDCLIGMAKAKAYLEDFKDAQIFLSKAKKMATKLASPASEDKNPTCRIKAEERKIYSLYKEYAKKQRKILKEKKKSKLTRSKLVTTLAGIGIATVGAVFFLKKNDNA